MLMVLNLVLLAVVVLVPLATSTLAAYLRAGGHEARIATALYGLVLEAAGIPWAILIAWSVRRGHLHQVGSPAAARTARLRAAAGGIVYLIGAGVALASPPAALGVYAAIVGYYLIVEQRAAAPPGGQQPESPPRSRESGQGQD